MNRLFSIVQILRSARRPVKATELAQALEVSQRTIYRDVAELQAQHVPIQGEAGIGYVLKKGFDLPPLMLTPDELEAALLGAQWVASRGDSDLERGARSLIEKIQQILPHHLQPILGNPTVTAALNPAVSDTVDTTLLRSAIREQRKLRITYLDEQGRSSERIVWPFLLTYFDCVRLLCTWCELRQGFRHFRTDRIQSLLVLEERFPQTVTQLYEQWQIEEPIPNLFIPPASAR